MDPTPETAESTVPPLEGKRSVTLQLVLVGLVALLLGVLILILFAPAPSPSLTWLTPAELARVTQPGLITRFKNRLMNATAPFWRWYRNRKPRVHVTISLRTQDSWAVNQTGLGRPVATNATGMRAWILTSAELGAWRNTLKSVPGSYSLGAGIQTVDGAQAAMVLNDSSKAGSNWTIKLAPKAGSDSIMLVIGITLTGFASSSPGKPGVGVTNFAAACQAAIPIGGGLVIDGGSANHRTGEAYWFIFSPTAIAARGR
jgi:hypothetical protein